MSESTCPFCGYDLVGSPLNVGSKCPECGRVADWRALRDAGDRWYRRKIAMFALFLVPSPAGAGVFYFRWASHRDDAARIAGLVMLVGCPSLASMLLLLALRMDGREGVTRRAWGSDVLLSVLAATGWMGLWLLPLVLAMMVSG